MEIREETKIVRYIEYDGKKFYEDGKGYWLGNVIGEDGKPHRKRLHIYVWERFNGPVPEGYDIHHIDRDTSNNDLCNLEAMPRSEHHQLHMSLMDKEKARENLSANVRPKASEWHKSDKGRAWHKVHYQNTMKDKWDETITLVCEWCGKTYETSVLMQSSSKFCSNSCKTASRYNSGIDNVERVCKICGKTFIVNKYSRTKTCSRECGVISANQTKLSKHRQKQSNP